MTETLTQVQVRLILETKCRHLADLLAAELPPGQQGDWLARQDQQAPEAGS